MGVTLYNKDGIMIASDRAISPEMRDLCDAEQGFVKDNESGDIIYPVED